MQKRAFDLVIALIAIIILAIPCLFLCWIIKLNSKGPAIHWSKRVGLHNGFFMMPKFRSMHLDTPLLETAKLPNPRASLTDVGLFIRRTSIDEIPQLISVLRGEMSIVGPRPALYSQLDLIARRKELGIDSLRPGITGWAQINGRDNISLDEKIRLDLEYKNCQSFSFDLKIIILTVWSVISSDGVSH